MATSEMATSPGPPSQSLPTSCLFLDKLAAELRNIIYELAFTPADVEEVDFFAAAPPSKALLSTCRQINSEARQIRRAAYRSYWQSTYFHLETNISTEDLINREWPSYKDIAEVRKLRITGRSRDGDHQGYDLIDQCGIWNWTSVSESGDHLHVYEDYLTLSKIRSPLYAPESFWRMQWVITHRFDPDPMKDRVPLPLSRQINGLVLSLAAPDPDDDDDETEWTAATERQFEVVRQWINNREGS